jgi:inositol phosphorylceramide mannosyltransferase catalytic subunit
MTDDTSGAGRGDAAARPLRPASVPIPRRIMQTWKTRDGLPPTFAAWSATVRAMNPDYAHVITDDADNRAFIADHFPWFLPHYDAYPREIQRVDAYRYFWLFLHGGFYLDLDVECLAPLDRYLGAGDVVLGRMGVQAQFAHSIPNAIMAARPRQIFWLLVMARLLDADPQAPPEYSTGPVLLKRAVDDWMGNRSASRAEARNIAARLSPGLRDSVCATPQIRLLQPREWYPINWAMPQHREMLRPLRREALPPGEAARRFPGSTLVTYWSHSWGAQMRRAPRPGASRKPVTAAQGPGSAQP